MKNRLLLIIAVFLIGTLLIGGCAESPVVEEAPEEVAIEDLNPEQAVMEFVAAIRDLDLDKAEDFIASEYREEFDEDFEELKAALEDDTAEAALIREIFSAVMANFEVTTTGHTIDGDEAVVSTVNTHPDPELLADTLMARMFEVMFSGDVDLENLTEEEGMQLMLEAFVDVFGEVERITTEAEVPMVREDGQWKIAGEVISDYTLDLDF